jgi:eukaryotic-like serine/threonine-protein kinase
MTLSRIGRFEVQRPLGSGSFATVWLARDEELDAWVAIKLLAENWSFNEDARGRFLEEARALRRLDSDRIVRVYDIGSLSDGRPYMVMEYADRGTLEDRMRLRGQLDQPFSVSEAVRQAIEIADCLVGVHDQRIVHRDVKPSNVLFRSISRERQEALRREGRPPATERTLLGDFGIARRLEGVLGQTKVVGSPQYMAPEQGDPIRARLVDQRSDVYSAAVVLYELLAGRLPLPFESATDFQRAQAAVRPVAPRPIHELRPDVPPALAAAIDRGLSRDPGDRFTSAWEWREALERSLSEPAVLVVPVADGRTLAEPMPAPGPVAGRRTSRVPAFAHDDRQPVLASTLPAPPRRTTDVLTAPPGHPAAGRPSAAGSSGLSLTEQAQVQRRARPAGAFVIIAGLVVMAGVLEPWARIANGRTAELSDRLGMAFRGGNLAVIGAIVLVAVGWRLWRTVRRWVATLASLAAAAAGAGIMAIGGYELVTIRDRVSSPRVVVVGYGFGLYLVLAGGAIGAVAGAASFRRLRRARTEERASAAVRAAATARASGR